MAEWLFFIGLLMAFIGFPTGLIDHWSNRPNDTWTFKGFGLGFLGVLLCSWVRP